MEWEIGRGGVFCVLSRGKTILWDIASDWLKTLEGIDKYILEGMQNNE